MSAEKMEKYDSGRVCPHCGRPIYCYDIPFFEIPVAITCQCILDQDAAAEKQREAVKKQRRIEELTAKSQMPPRLRACTFDVFQRREGTEKAMDTCRTYADRFPEMREKGLGLILVGNTGSGKTHLAAAIVNSVIQQCYSAVFYKAAKLFDFAAENHAALPDGCERSSLLVLDDFGASNDTESRKATLQKILDYRIDGMRPTILTTNIPPKEWASRLDVRTVDRLMDKSLFRVISITAPSMRQERRRSE